MSESILVTERTGTTLLLKLNRPQKRNAVNDDLILAIEKAIDAFKAETKVIIIHAEGEHFSAGLDLSELKERNSKEGLEHSRMWHRVMDKIQFGAIPVIAVLKGACVGGGLEIATASHIRIAEESAFYALPEGMRGIFVGGGGSLRIPKLIGTAAMTDMMLTGRVLNADEGYEKGLTQYLVENGKGLKKAMEMAERMAQNAEMTTYAVLQVLPKIQEASHQEASMMESLTAALAQDSPEAKKRLRDFLEGKAKKVGE
ncbi:crotonase/enoyl-CoA hydratase family protein [Jiulongibacter sediminis]|uniref:Enoyl-CoA hydratase n=1 Tax=Jiulongibacter sediminis TaxID=1605367 RepID=A0A0N8H998_9BACT|nr:crotonase/enoyl-CoA hydratase family protein [Jiulongibacter sediminis]KPM46772.1 enoyl-CoA hydratase [Jiulongibacter sediminis]TBX21676.1 enoyl-CoA hydratase [Jiulongibacter sediminis]